MIMISTNPKKGCQPHFLWGLQVGGLSQSQEHWLKLCTASLLSPVLSARLQAEADDFFGRLDVVPEELALLQN